MIPPADDRFWIVGLGNPGLRYADTRHNIGFMVVDALLRSGRAEKVPTNAPAEVFRMHLAESDGTRELCLVKPSTYMNRSGTALRALGWKPDAEAEGVDRPALPLLLIVDDLYLPFGRLRLRGDGSDGGHNGLKSVTAALGSSAYSRIRCGVGPQPEGVPAEEFVLDRFQPEEQDELPAFVSRAADCARSLLVEGLATAMNTFNR